MASLKQSNLKYNRGEMLKHVFAKKSDFLDDTLRVCRTYDMKMYLKSLYYLFSRPSETAKIRVCDILKEEDVVFFRNTKNGKTYPKVVPECFKTVFYNYVESKRLQGAVYLFHSPRDLTKPIPYITLVTRFRVVLRRSGYSDQTYHIDTRGNRLNKYSLYTYRHLVCTNFVNYCMENNIPFSSRMLAYKMGHSTTYASDRYVHHNLDVVKKVTDRVFSDPEMKKVKKMELSVPL